MSTIRFDGPRRRRFATVAAAAVVSAAVTCGAVTPAASALDDPIAPHTDAQGRYYVDAWATNTSANKTPATNAAIAVLSPMLNYWQPAAVPAPQYDSNGALIPRSLGTIVDQGFHDANIAASVEITRNRTPEQADQAYLFDRRNQNYSAIQGFGPWAPEFRSGSNAGTTIPDAIPADAPTHKYEDGGNANGQWADTASQYGPMVNLVNVFRNSAASTSSAKAYYNYARPWRWSSDVSVVPALESAKGANPLTDGGYPSGHTNAAWLASLAFAYAAPERFDQFLTSASDIGHSRIVAGMHSEGDVIGGRMMATAVAAGALNQSGNQAAMAAARANATTLFATLATGDDAFADEAADTERYTERLTYGLPRTGDTTLPVVVPKGAEVLIESRLPYLTAEQRRWVLQSTGLGSGYALLDDAEGWGRLNLLAAAHGYGAFDTDVSVVMNGADGGFSAADTWTNDIDGSGSLTKSGTGELTLSGANSFTGGVDLEGGVLRAASPTAWGAGSVKVGDASLEDDTDGTLVVGRDLTLSPTSRVSLTVDGAEPALAVSGAASFAGALTVDIAPGFTPADDQIIGTYGSQGAGAEFDRVEFAGLPAGYTPQVVIRDGAIHLVNTSAAPETVDTAAVPGKTLAATGTDAPVAGSVFAALLMLVGAGALVLRRIRGARRS